MFVVLHYFITLLSVAVLAVGDNYDVGIEHGRVQYEVLKLDTRAPRFGECWQRALDDLHNGCRDLTDDVQARLALSFANCFLLKSGMRTYDCAKESPVSDCLKEIDNNAFTAYSNFFTHTHNMCQFLQAQVWRQRTQGTILSLSESSAKVAEGLKEATKIQDVIVSNQIQVLEYQQQIMENGSVLSRAIEMSRSNVKEMLQEFRSSTDEQRALIFSVFDRVAKLQNLVISEVSWIYTMIFYGVTMLVHYLVTATKRTAEARLPLFAILSINLALERMVCTMSLPADFDFVDEIPELINERVWLLRKTSLLTCCIVILYFAYTFQDYNVINNRLLQDICKQNRELCQAIEVIKKAQNMTNDHTDFSALSIALHNNDTDVAREENDDDDDDGNESDTNSFDSTQTDRTWRDDVADPLEADVNDEDDEFEEDDDIVEDFSFLSGEFYTAANSSPTTDSGKTTPSTYADLGNPDPVLLSAPNQQPPDILNRSCRGLMMPTDQPNSGRKKPRKTSRRGGWSEEGSRPATPVHHYNLRRRITNFENPILDSETPNSFGKLVSQLSHITQKHSLLIRQKFHELQLTEDSSTRAPNSISVFSSDEEN